MPRTCTSSDDARVFAMGAEKDLGQVNEERDESTHGEQQQFADADEAPHAKLNSVHPLSSSFPAHKPLQDPTEIAACKPSTLHLADFFGGV